MSTSVQTLIDQIIEYQYNPAAIQRAVLQVLSDVSNGQLEVVDPTNPFVFCLEAGAVGVAAFMIKNEVNTRKQYPSVAQTQEDLYLHMSDRDYAGRFATPSRATFEILISKDEVMSKMVTDPATGIRKLVIPRNSFFTVADTVFSLQYPIEIRQPQHGGLQVMYDASVASPLQELTTNVLNWEIRRNGSDEYIWFEFEAWQFKILSQTANVNNATDFKLDLPLEDLFYYARVYIQTSSGAWKEILTTHSDQVYDPLTPTAVLKVVDQTLTVRIPQIYVSAGLVAGTVRVDVYQTKGALEMLLSNYPISAFVATWMAYDVADETIFTAPLKTLKQVMAYSSQAATGGSDGLTFEELRTRVIHNAIGQPTIPITNAQLEAALTDLGYVIVKNIDVITNRVFLATRPMPTPSDPKLITAAASSIETLAITVDDLIKLSSVIDNGASVTITPDTLYRTKDGVVSVVLKQEIDALLAMAPDQRALVVSADNFLYTPFHYVLDMTDNEFAIRPYYLDNPSILTKLFVAENDTTLLEIGTQSYGITRTKTGYTLQIVTQSDDNVKAMADDELFVQLAFIPPGERDRAYLMGVYAGRTDTNERIYNFDLSMTYNVDSNDYLELTQFFMYSQEARVTKALLQTDFDILYATTAVMGPQWMADSVDQALGRFLLPDNIVGMTQETLRVRFGYSLQTLWSRSRTVLSSVAYKTWAMDVPRTYEKDVYLTDATTGAAFTVVNGQVQYTVLHKKGDPVLDADNNPVYQYRAGDVMLDGDGQPIVLNPRGVLRQLDLMLIEGAYWFATDSSSGGYRSDLTKTLVDWLTADLTSISGVLLEQTRLYFYPKTTLGLINVMIKDGLTTAIPAGQSFKVTLFVNKSVYVNDDLRTQLTQSTVKTISSMLDNVTVSISAITSALRDQYGDDVIDVQLTGLGGSANLHALTVLDEGDRCSIRKRLVALSDDSLIVQEDVTVDFVRHEIVS